MKSHFVRMARYNTWANTRLYGMARDLPDPSYRKNVGAFFGSMHGTLNHLLTTVRIWMRRFTGTGDQPKKLDAILFEDFASLATARVQEDDQIRRYVDGLTEDEIRAELNYATTRGVPQRNRLGDLLAHLFNHQTHHRGQAHAILTVLGIAEPKPLDLLAMLREKV